MILPTGPLGYPVAAGRAVGEAVLEGRSPLEADIPSEVGGVGNAIWDTALEQPSYADDSVDVPGPSVGDVVGGAEDVVDDAGNAADAVPGGGSTVVGVVVLLVVLGAALWLVRPLLGIIEGVTTS